MSRHGFTLAVAVTNMISTIICINPAHGQICINTLSAKSSKVSEMLACIAKLEEKIILVESENQSLREQLDRLKADNASLVSSAVDKKMLSLSSDTSFINSLSS